MPIEIKPHRLRTHTGANAGIGGRRFAPPPETPIVTPKRAHVNIIPSPESLATLVRSAVAALRRGTFWDRGSILNLLV